MQSPRANKFNLNNVSIGGLFDQFPRLFLMTDRRKSLIPSEPLAIHDKVRRSDLYPPSNKAVYTTTSVAYRRGSNASLITFWCVFVLRDGPPDRPNYQPNDQPTNRPTDQPTIRVTYRVACTQLKTDGRRVSGQQTDSISC